MHKLITKHMAVLISLMFVHLTAHAAGLGKLNVLSGLGEPLKAEIKLLSVTPKELSSISAAIASNQAYADQGIEKPVSHRGIDIVVTKNSRGESILKLSSADPITDAFVDMLIQVDWSAGRLLREYTVLLDPPGYKSEFDSKVAKSASLPNVTTRTYPSAGQVTTSKLPPAMPYPSARTHQRSTASATYVKPAPYQAPPLDYAQNHKTQRGDTLYKIAARMKPQGVSLEQMLVGLYKTNPRAFSGKNMNRLKVGQIIRAPSEQMLSGVSRKKANKQVRVHTANWNAYKNNLAGVVNASKNVESASNEQSNSGKVTAAHDQSETAAAGPKDVVKLSAGDAKAVKSLEDKVASLEEESIAKDGALKEAQSRTSDLEKQIADMQKLLALKNDAMAKVQNDAAAQQEPEILAGEVTKPVVPEIEPEEVVIPAVEVAKNEAEKIEQTPVVKEVPVEKPIPKKSPAKPVVVAEPVEEPSFMDTLMGTVSGVVETIKSSVALPQLGMGAGALALLGGSWWFLRNKRKSSLTSFEEGIMTTGGLKANTVFGNTSGGTVDTGDTSFLTDFSAPGNVGSMIDAHDVDPIAEAEVYMAYGRDAQAEEILKDAIAKEPQRYELHLKLLEIYQAGNNPAAFETIASEMYTNLGGSDATWLKVAAMGVAFDAGNPLYKGAASPAGAVEPEPAADVPEEINVAANVETEASIEVESFDTVVGSADESTLKTDTDTVSPDTVIGDTPVSKMTAETPEDNSFDLDIGELEFNTDLDDVPDLDAPAIKAEIPTSAPEVETVVPEVKETEVADLNFDMPLMPEMDSAVEVNNDVQALADDVSETINVEAPENSSLDANTVDFPSIGLAVPEESVAEAAVEVQAPDVVVPEVALSTPDLESSTDTAFDLSGIDLNIDTVSGDSASAAEPEDVETKLDLVMAYLDMEDNIGAKELLDEVMNEGGENQRKRATELLAKIG